MAAVLLGLSLGWSAGIAPGPLTALVLTASLRSGFAAGARVAVVPLLTDAPIVLVSLLVSAALPDRALTGMAVAGGLYLVWLGIGEVRSSPAASLESSSPGAGRDLRRGIVANLLSPHPWVFWLGVGGPTLIAAWEDTPASALGFLAAFYGMLVGTKLAVALGVHRSRRWLDDRWYRRLAGGGGVALVAVGVVVVVSAL